MSRDLEQLRLNVGFLVGQPVGNSRDFDIEIPKIHLEPDVDLHQLHGVVHVSRTAQGILLQAKIYARLRTDCARCLTDIWQTLHTDFTELYNFSAKTRVEGELVLPDTMQINLLPLVRDYLLVEIPINPICKPDCQGLCPICGNNLNEDNCTHDEDLLDPRLSILRSLLDKED